MGRNMGRVCSKITKAVVSLAFLAIASLSLASPIKVLTLRDFKGLNTKTSSYDLPPEYASAAFNIRFSTIGSLVKRYARSKYNSTSLGSNPITYLERIYIGSNKYLLAVYDTALKVGDDDTGTFSDLKTGLTSGKRWQGATYKNFHYMGNGTDDNIRTDGTSSGTKVMGCQVPSPAPTATATSGSGLEIGDYKYKVTFVYDGYQESNGSPSASVTTTSGNQQVSLTDIPTGDSSVTARKIYRTSVGGSVFREVTTISDNTTTTYTDSTPDSSLGDTIPTDHDIPPKFKYIRAVKERLFLAGNPDNKSYLYYTSIEGSISYPDIVPATNYIPISEDDGDIITGLAIDPTGSLIVFKQNSIRRVYIQGSPAEWAVSESLSPNGCIAPYSIAESPYGIIYLSRNGSHKEIRVFNGQVSKLISERIEPTLSNISDSYISNCAGVYHEGKYYLAYTDKTTGVNYNNRVLVVDLKRDAFSIDTGKNINAFAVFSGEGDWDELYSGDSVDGYVRREDTYSQDIYHRYKTELDSGSYTYCESSGTEEAPEVTLVSSDISSEVGTKTWQDLDEASDTWNDYSGTYDTWWPSGSLTSAVLEINAKALKKLYWTADTGSNGAVTFQLRTGDTEAACQSASWSEKFASSGADISGVTAAKYIQYRAMLYTNDASVVSTPKLYRSDYVLWINAGLGTLDSSSVDFVYETGDLDLGAPFLTKRLRSLRVKGISEGSYTIKWYLDGETTPEGTFTLSSGRQVKYFPLTACFGERVRLRIEESSNEPFELKEVSIIYNEEPLRW